MDALCPVRMRQRRIGTWIFLPAAMAVCLTTATTDGAVFRTKNFTVNAPTAAIAKQVGETAGAVAPGKGDRHGRGPAHGGKSKCPRLPEATPSIA